MYRRIAFTGPSGTGKTTLVNFVKQELNLPHLNGSSGQIKTTEQNEKLTQLGLKVGGGHRNVIQSGHLHPVAAIQNQWDILERRIELFNEQKEFVTDRCTIDSWVYYLNQCSIYHSTEDSERFLGRCYHGLKPLTHIIFIPTMIPVEDNGSRIPNQFYQEELSTPLFQRAILRFRKHALVNCPGLRFHTIWHEDLQARKDEIKDFIYI